jgi:hypothetical protein
MQSDQTDPAEWLFCEFLSAVVNRSLDRRGVAVAGSTASVRLSAGMNFRDFLIVPTA